MIQDTYDIKNLILSYFNNVENTFIMKEKEHEILDEKVKHLQNEIDSLKQNELELSSVSAIVTAKNEVIKLENENTLLTNKICYLQIEISKLKNKLLCVDNKVNNTNKDNCNTNNNNIKNSNDEDNDEEELEISEFLWKNKTYYIDENNNIYSKNDDETIGDKLGILNNYTQKNGKDKMKPKWY